MKPSAPNRRSYVEQFHFRQKLTGKSPEESSIKKLYSKSFITIKKKGILKGQKSSHLWKSTTPRRPSAIPIASRKSLPVQVAPVETYEDSFDASPDNRKSSHLRKKRTGRSASESSTGSILKKRGPQSAFDKPPSFSSMVKDYATALNLTEMERQCLGFGDDVDAHEMDDSKNDSSSKPMSKWGFTTDENNNMMEESKRLVDAFTWRKNYHRKKQDSAPSTTTDRDLPKKGLLKPHPAEPSTIRSASPCAPLPVHTKPDVKLEPNVSYVKPPDSDSSAWSKFADAFIWPKNWVGMTPDSAPATTTKDLSKPGMEKDGGHFDTESDGDEESTVAANPTSYTEVAPYKVLKNGLLSLLENACSDTHQGHNANTCFKCQHKDCFRSLMLNQIDEMRYIWKDKTLSSNEKDVKMIEIFEAWTYQLTEQNLSLAEAYSTSAKAASRLKSVLLQHRASMKNHQTQMDKEKALNDSISYELSLRDQTISTLKVQLDYESELRRETNRKLEETQADVNSLTELIIRLRDKGVWDIQGLPMADETFQKIFHQDYYLYGTKVIGSKEFSQKRKEWRNEIEMLKAESDTLKEVIRNKDVEIQGMKTAARRKN